MVAPNIIPASTGAASGWGGRGSVDDAIKRRMIEKLLEDATSSKPIQHPMQGYANLSSALLLGLEGQQDREKLRAITDIDAKAHGLPPAPVDKGFLGKMGDALKGWGSQPQPSEIARVPDAQPVQQPQQMAALDPFSAMSDAGGIGGAAPPPMMPEIPPPPPPAPMPPAATPAMAPGMLNPNPTMGGGDTGQYQNLATQPDPARMAAALGGSGPQISGGMPGRQAEFVQAMAPHAQQVSQQTGLDPRLVIAQGALESGWGKSAPGNNFFGIKSHGQPGGQTLPTSEVVNGQPVRINDSFRQYGGMGESAQGYADFLQKNKRYQPMLGAQGMEAQIAALGKSGYATDPNYASKVASIARSLQMGQGGGSPMMSGSPAMPANETMDFRRRTDSFGPAVLAPNERFPERQQLASMDGMPQRPTFGAMPYREVKTRQAPPPTFNQPQIGQPQPSFQPAQPPQPQQQPDQQRMAVDAYRRQMEVYRDELARERDPEQRGKLLQRFQAAQQQYMQAAQPDLDIKVIEGIPYGWDKKTGKRVDLANDTMRAQADKTSDTKNLDRAIADWETKGRVGERPTIEGLKRASAMQSQVQIDQRGETEFAKAVGKHQAERFDKIVQGASEAQSMTANIQTLRDIGSRVTTGKNAQVTAALGPYVEMLGIKVDGLDDLQTYEAVISKIAPQMRVPGSGATSDFEMRTFLKALPSLGNTPGGNDLISKTLDAMSEHKIAAGDIASRAMAGELTAREAEKQLRALPDPLTLWKQSREQPGPIGGDRSDGWRDMGNGVRIREKR